MGLTSTVDVLKKAARLAGIDEGWDGIGTLTSDAVTRLLEARAFNGFLDWIPGACTQAPEKRRKAAPRTRAAKAA